MLHKPLQFCGEVVETFRKEGRSIARIVLKSGCIDVCVDGLDDIHLGDEVLIDLEITINHVQQKTAAAGPSTGS